MRTLLLLLWHTGQHNTFTMLSCTPMLVKTSPVCHVYTGGRKAAVVYHLGCRHPHGLVHWQQHPRDPRVDHAQCSNPGQPFCTPEALHLRAPPPPLLPPSPLSAPNLAETHGLYGCKSSFSPFPVWVAYCYSQLHRQLCAQIAPFRAC